MAPLIMASRRPLQQLEGALSQNGRVFGIGLQLKNSSIVMPLKMYILDMLRGVWHVYENSHRSNYENDYR